MTKNLGKISATRDLVNSLMLIVKRYEVYRIACPEAEHNKTLHDLLYFVEYLEQDYLTQLEKENE